MNPRSLPVGRDDQPDGDGLPVWAPTEGMILVPGIRAWRPLGVGHRCQTFLGWSTDRWAPVTVKIVRPHQVDHPRARMSLQREITALENNPHPALPQLYGDDLDHEAPYLVEQYLDGPDLDHLLGSCRISTGSIIALAAQLLAALVPLHSRGLAHLDIKPANVIICNSRPVLIDLGSARRIGTRQPPGHPVGTEGYASPEMEACAPITASMDLYGVGATLAAALGRRRWVGSRGTALGMLITDLTRADPLDRPTLERALERSSELASRRRRLWPSRIDQLATATPARFA